MTQDPTPTHLVRFFGWHDIEDAAEWAKTGIAIHRNFDVDGLVIGGKVRSGAAFHVLSADKEALLAWGQRYGQRPNWLQTADRRGMFAGIWHFDVFGGPAKRLLAEAAKAQPGVLDD